MARSINRFTPARLRYITDGDGQDGGAGSSSADQDGSDGDGQDDDSGDDDGADALGDAGKQALDRMKEQRNTARSELRAFKALGLTPEQIKALQDGKGAGAGDGDGDAPDPEKIREDARREARAEIQRDRVMDKIEAKAGARFNLDPEDVAALLMRRHDINDFLDGDKIDVEAIGEALDDLLEKKPNLAAAQGDRKRFKGDADGGTRKESRPEQLTREQVKRMSPQEIVKAKADGRLVDLLAGKN